MHDGDHVANAIHKQLLRSTEKIVPGQIQVYLDSGESNCTVILDGYDEILNRNISTTDEFFTDPNESNCGRLKLLITTRFKQGSGLSHGLDIGSSFTKIELCDFDDDMIEKYVQLHYPSSWEVKLEVIRRHERLTHMAHRPMLLSLICFILDENPNLISELLTLGKLFEVFVSALYHRDYKDREQNYKEEETQRRMLKFLQELGEVVWSTRSGPNVRYHLTRADFEARGKANVMAEGVRIGLLIRSEFRASGSLEEPHDNIEFPHGIFQDKCVGYYLSKVTDALDGFLNDISDCETAIAKKYIIAFACHKPRSSSVHKVMEKLASLRNPLRTREPEMPQSHNDNLCLMLFKLCALINYESQSKGNILGYFPPLLSDLSKLDIDGYDCLYFMYFLEYAYASVCDQGTGAEYLVFWKPEDITLRKSTWGIEFNSFRKWSPDVFPNLKCVKICDSEVLFESSDQHSSNERFSEADVRSFPPTIVSLENIHGTFSLNALLSIINSQDNRLKSLNVSGQNVEVLTMKETGKTGNIRLVESIEKLALSGSEHDISLIKLFLLTDEVCPYLTSLSLYKLRLSVNGFTNDQNQNQNQNVITEQEHQAARERSGLSLLALTEMSAEDILNDIRIIDVFEVLSVFCSNITTLTMTRCNVVMAEEIPSETETTLPNLKELNLCGTIETISFSNCIQLLSKICPKLETLTFGNSVVSLPDYIETERILKVIVPDINSDVTIISLLTRLIPTLKYVTFGANQDQARHKADNERGAITQKDGCSASIDCWIPCSSCGQDHRTISVPNIGETELSNSDILDAYGLQQDVHFHDLLSLGNILQPELEGLTVQKVRCNMTSDKLQNNLTSREDGAASSAVSFSQDTVIDGRLSSLNKLEIHTAVGPVQMMQLCQVLSLRTSNLQVLKVNDCQITVPIISTRSQLQIDFQLEFLTKLSLKSVPKASPLSLCNLVMFLSRTCSNLRIMDIAHAKLNDATRYAKDSESGETQTTLRCLKKLKMSDLWNPLPLATVLELVVSMCPSLEVLLVKGCELALPGDNYLNKNEQYPTCPPSLELVFEAIKNIRIGPTLLHIEKICSNLLNVTFRDLEILETLNPRSCNNRNDDETSIPTETQMKKTLHLQNITCSFPFAEILREIALSHQNLYALDISCREIDVLQGKDQFHIRPEFTLESLRTLCFSAINHPVFMANIMSLTMNFPNLTSLDITSCNFAEDGEIYPRRVSSVREINLTTLNRPFNLLKQLKVLTNLCTNLRSLTIEGSKVIIDKNGWDNASWAMCPNLTSVYIDQPYKEVTHPTHTELQDMFDISIPLIKILL